MTRRQPQPNCLLAIFAVSTSVLAVAVSISRQSPLLTETRATASRISAISSCIDGDLEAFTIRELKAAGAEIELDEHGHATSLIWEAGPEYTFSDTNLRQAASLTRLQELWLIYTAVTDCGLQSLRSMQQLESLGLVCEYRRGKPATITSAGIQSLSGLTNLRVLRLEDADVTDRGLVHLRGLINLEDLDLFGTEISDAGLVHLRSLKKLKYLNISETQWEKAGRAITPAAVTALQKHLPDCDIDY